MPIAQSVRYQFRLIAHGKMIAFTDYHLAGVRVERLPTKLESERIIAFTKDCQQRQLAEWTAESRAYLFVQLVTSPRIAHVVMKRSYAFASDSRSTYAASCQIQAPADPKAAGSDTGNQLRHDIELAHRGTSY